MTSFFSKLAFTSVFAHMVLIDTLSASLVGTFVLSQVAYFVDMILNFAHSQITYATLLGTLESS